ncbi:unnamed protein product [Auanema sp. JU1783]|nr:unnamed protein product [Auanema sp. JU1783]
METSVQENNENQTYYDAVRDNQWVKQAFATYDWAKHSCSLVENTLNTVEKGVYGVSEIAQRKATNTYNTLYVRPRNAVAGVYSAGKGALENGKVAAVHGTTVGLGAAVLATQFGLALSAGGAEILLDSLNSAKGAGRRVIYSIKQLEEALVQRIWACIHEVQRLANIPISHLTETTHSLLDLIRALVEKSLSLQIKESPDQSVGERVTGIASAIVSSLRSKAYDSVIDPINDKTKVLLDQLSGSFLLVDIMKSKGEWVRGKVEDVSASLSELKTRLEDEARHYSAAPEEMLMKSIKSNADQLVAQLTSLRSMGQQLFGDDTYVDGAITYLLTLEESLKETETIYEVRDEVLKEAHQRFMELKTWASDVLHLN